MKRVLNKKEKHRYHDCDDPDYYGIRDIDVLLGDANEKDYYKSILVIILIKVLLRVIAKFMIAEETEIKIYQ